MGLARRDQIDRSEMGYYHLYARCVRQCFLCGGEFEHRRKWIEERVKFLAQYFAIDICSVAVLSNHYHLLVRNQPEVVKEWSTTEVWKRWKKLFPGSMLNKHAPGMGGSGDLGPEETRSPIQVVRDQLCDLSWLMRAINEFIARRANREEGRKGRFWEGRFKSAHVLDDEALLQCSIYIDLNEVRAGMIEVPEESEHSSIRDRIEVKTMHEQRRARRAKARPKDKRITHHDECDMDKNTSLSTHRKDEAGIWLVPIERAGRQAGQIETTKATAEERRRNGLFDMTAAQYISLVDAMGRIAREGKGAIDASLAPILERMRVDVTHLTTFVTGTRELYGSVAGAPARVKEIATRRRRTRAVSITRVQ